MKTEPTNPFKEALEYAQSLIEDVQNGNDTWTKVLDPYTVADLKAFFEDRDSDGDKIDIIPDVYELAQFILKEMILR